MKKNVNQLSRVPGNRKYVALSSAYIRTKKTDKAFNSLLISALPEWLDWPPKKQINLSLELASQLKNSRNTLKNYTSAKSPLPSKYPTIFKAPSSALVPIITGTLL